MNICKPTRKREHVAGVKPVKKSAPSSPQKSWASSRGVHLLYPVSANKGSMHMRANEKERTRKTHGERKRRMGKSFAGGAG